ncbi:MAG: peptidase [Opitutia bacterium]|nr:zinc metallopeptidase [Opitutaceae bacterium]PHX72405.1 MAG: peptidase [Opitutae bacterium]
MIFSIVLIGVPLLLGLYAQMRVMSAYRKNVQIPSRNGITGRAAAAAVMESAGIHDVEIVEVEGMLSDHYDPSKKRLALSPDNFHGTSLAALGVAAHEAGHAIQDKVGYGMMAVRQSLVPAVQVASPIAMILGGFAIYLVGGAVGGLLLKIAIGALAVITVFQFVTLPVEFDATARAKRQLVHLGIVGQDEMAGVHETLDAAALTYVAAFVASLGQMLHLIMMLTGGSRRDD